MMATDDVRGMCERVNRVAVTWTWQYPGEKEPRVEMDEEAVNLELSILADALEETGAQATSDALRAAIASGKRPLTGAVAPNHYWVREYKHGPFEAHRLGGPLFDQLAPGQTVPGDFPVSLHDTFADALLALAVALTHFPRYEWRGQLARHPE